MKQHDESYFVFPAIKAIASCPGGCTTQHIKEIIHKFCNLNEIDNIPFPSRGKEPRYYQIVGNMISHKNRQLFMYIDAREATDEKGNPLNYKIFSLNEAGKKLFEDCQDEVGEKTSCLVTSTNVNNVRLINYVLAHGLDKRPPTSKKLLDEVLAANNYECECGRLFGEKHVTFTDACGHQFMNGHHLVPMKYSKRFFPVSLDCEANLVPACPNDHAKLHHGTEDEFKPLLKALYDSRIDALNRSGIYISFDELLEMYVESSDSTCEKEGDKCKSVGVDDIITSINLLGGHAAYENIVNVLKTKRGKEFSSLDEKRVFDIISENEDVFMPTRSLAFAGYRLPISRLVEENLPIRKRLIDANRQVLDDETRFVFNAANAMMNNEFVFDDLLAYQMAAKKLFSDVKNIESWLKDGLDNLILAGLIEKADDEQYRKAYCFL